MRIPPEYNGREQSYLKHRVLHEYLIQWGHKLGSLARRGRVKLWYVDCFAGPWKHHDENLQDTSIDIGLRALEEAGRTWQSQGHQVSLGAIFVEKNKAAYHSLRAYLDKRSGTVETIAWAGRFGDHVERIRERIASDPAFIFIDPTGFKGVAIDYIAPLVQERMRDMLVNVMFNHINRFKDVEQRFLREQMRDFFGLGEDVLPARLSEGDLLKLYRSNLKSRCGLQYAADLAVPHPTWERTWFRLVIGGKHPEVLRVFREVESRVMGREAASVRTSAKQRAETERTRQLSLGSSLAPKRDHWYDAQNQEDRQAVIEQLCITLSIRGRLQFEHLWPDLLEDHHVTYQELTQLVVNAARDGRLIIEPNQPRRRTIKGQEWLSRPATRV